MNQTNFWKMGLLVFSIGLLIWIWMPRATYPKVSSPESDRILRMLGTACSSRSSERIENVKAEIAKLNLPEAESKAFEQIIALADEGRWPEAQRASLLMAADQIN